MNETNELSYVNNKGKRVVVHISNHAVERWIQRWNAAYPDDRMAPGQARAALAATFNAATRFKPTSAIYKKRMRRNGEDSLYFRGDRFVFVVQACVLVTVEIGAKDMRHLNRKPAWAAMPDPD